MQIAQRIILTFLSGMFLLDSPASAQEVAAAGQVSNGTPQSSVPSHAVGDRHPFWDKENIVLFAGVGAGRALDYASTRHFRDRGVDEWLLTNQIVDNKPLFAGIEVAALAASIGVSYLFHRTGHHRLERWVSVIHIGVAVGSSARNYTLRAPSPPGTAH